MSWAGGVHGLSRGGEWDTSIGSIQKPPALGSPWRSSDLSVSMGIVSPRGPRGKTINTGLTGMDGMEKAGMRSQPKGLGPRVPRVKDSRG